MKKKSFPIWLPNRIGPADVQMSGLARILRFLRCLRVLLLSLLPSVPKHGVCPVSQAATMLLCVTPNARYCVTFHGWLYPLFKNHPDRAAATV